MNICATGNERNWNGIDRITAKTSYYVKLYVMKPMLWMSCIASGQRSHVEPFDNLVYNGTAELCYLWTPPTSLYPLPTDTPSPFKEKKINNVTVAIATLNEKRYYGRKAFNRN